MITPSPSASPAPSESAQIAALRQHLGQRTLVLIGLMGAGKSSLGKRLAIKLDLPFKDADDEIERAAGMSIAEIFDIHGEAYFRDGERKVIARLLGEGPLVLATGGGAYMNAETRDNIARMGISIWLRAELDVLMRRVRRRTHRPLLQVEDPESVMQRLMDARYPVYRQADITIESRDSPHEVILGDLITALGNYFDLKAEGTQR